MGRSKARHPKRITTNSIVASTDGDATATAGENEEQQQQHQQRKHQHQQRKHQHPQIIDSHSSNNVLYMRQPQSLFPSTVANNDGAAKSSLGQLEVGNENDNGNKYDPNKEDDGEDDTNESFPLGASRKKKRRINPLVINDDDEDDDSDDNNNDQELVEKDTEMNNHGETIEEENEIEIIPQLSLSSSRNNDVDDDDYIPKHEYDIILIHSQNYNTSINNCCADDGDGDDCDFGGGGDDDNESQQMTSVLQSIYIPNVQLQRNIPTSTTSATTTATVTTADTTVTTADTATDTTADTTADTATDTTTDTTTDTANHDNTTQRCKRIRIETKNGIQKILIFLVNKLQNQTSTVLPSSSSLSPSSSSSSSVYIIQEYQSILSAIQSNLIRLSLQQDYNQQQDANNHNYPGVILQFQLTNKAKTLCSPISIGQTILSSSSNSSSSSYIKKKKKTREIQETANLIRDSMLELYPTSILKDFLSDSNSDNGNNNKQKMNGFSGGDNDDVDVITAKMVYNAIDNAHLNHHYESQQQQNTNNNNDHNQHNQTTTILKSCKIQGLVPTLREYQKGAVEWMIQRERGNIDDNGWEICWLVILEHQHVADTSTTTCNYNLQTLFQWKKTQCNKQESSILFYNPVTGWVVQSYNDAKKFTVNEVSIDNAIIRGGILAESMGLGKTVELLACILSNPCPSSFMSNPTEISDSFDVSSYNDISVSTPHTDLCELSCYCGRDPTRHSLPWIQCYRCKQTMHGVCAGFTSLAELMSRTKDGGRKCRISDERHCTFCQYNIACNGSDKDNLIGCRTTLIVTPPTILNQWEREIKRHISIGTNENQRALKVLVYPGVKVLTSLPHKQALQNEQMKMLLPSTFADADVVLTTFDVLRGELFHCSDNPFVGSRKMRLEKKYRVVPSPLVSMKWWRVCLDEAQRIETPTTSSAQMVLNLSAQNRWCVSGTPIGRGKLDDLLGLYLFLDSKPFCYKQCFNTYLKPHYRDISDRIKHCTFDLMWRSTKSNNFVREQMGIPEQIQKTVLLKFSTVERHFYDHQLEKTIIAAQTATSGRRKKAKKKETEALSLHLHHLRAACCHPQVGSSGISKVTRKGNKLKQSADGSNMILNMAQILDKLIDDAKGKVEESQRVFTLHTNAVACLYKLKAEAIVNERISADDNEISLLKKSCDLYFEVLNVSNENALPSPVIGEAVLNGSIGFQLNHTVVRDGKAKLIWLMKQCDVKDSLSDVVNFPQIWSKFDFTISTKKINSLLVRHLIEENLEVSRQHNMYAKDCVLQVSNAAMGGAFVDAIHFTLPFPTNNNRAEWFEFDGLRPNKSKNWRVLVKSFHSSGIDKTSVSDPILYSVCLEMQLMEPEINSDNLQRMHILHNFARTLTTLSEKILMDPSGNGNHDDDRYSKSFISSHLSKMQGEQEDLESHYIEAARIIQEVSDQKLKDKKEERAKVLLNLKSLCQNEIEVEQPWSIDLLSWCHLYGNQQLRQSMCAHVERRLFELFDDPSQTFRRRAFPDFDNIDGLNFALSMRLENQGDFFTSLKIPICFSQVETLSTHPSEGEVHENSHCRKCRADWHQSGPICQSCKLEKKVNHFEDLLKEVEINCVLTAMMEWFNDNLSRMKLIKNASRSKSINMIHKKMEIFFEYKTAVLKELEAARAKWRTHFDLLSDIDELNQCKRSMRLSYDDENLFVLNEQELAFIIQPCDVAALIMDHTSKQAMADAVIRQSKEKLRFLKNQHLSMKEGNDDKCCTICLAPFEDNRGVLRCGHVFHYSPCIEKLLSRGGGSLITCPMRCAIRTRKEDILIATEKASDDGSKTNKKIQGCWGTKIDRLIADIIDVNAKAQKSIVFSQWDDMLTIMEHALAANDLQYIRPKTGKQFGNDMMIFRNTRCNVLLMHVKNGAEGLTLVEANHVFMIEPLLNHSLDSQAVNRIHRIGQTQKTYVHRYLISDTIEMKIDRKRVERQENNPDETTMIVSKKNSLKQDTDICTAGGFDGGFSKSELMELLEC